MIEAVVLVVFPFCMVFAAASDLLSMTIANRISAILLAAFLLIAPWAGMGAAEIGWHLLAGASVLAVTFGLFALGGMGGGDAKLLSATALWMGFGMPLIAYLFTASFLGGILTLSILAYRRSALAVFTDRNIFLRNFSEGAKGVPYGIALGLAGLVVFPESPLMVWTVNRLIAG